MEREIKLLLEMHEILDNILNSAYCQVELSSEDNKTLEEVKSIYDKHRKQL